MICGAVIWGRSAPRQAQYHAARSSNRPSDPGGLVSCASRSCARSRAAASASGAARSSSTKSSRVEKAGDMGCLVASSGAPRVSQPRQTPHPKNNLGNEIMPLARPVDLLLALSLLSRLPLPEPEQSDWSRQARAVWAYPLVGLVLGALACLAGLLAHWLGLPAPLVALVTLATLIAASGAMHEDGLADCADGFWGGWTPARRLE